MNKDKIIKSIYETLNTLPKEVNTNQWEKIYNIFLDKVQNKVISSGGRSINIGPLMIPLLTSILYEVEIDPLPDFHFSIPDYFLYDIPELSNIKFNNIEIPKGIKQIGGLAFCRSQIKNIYIPSSVILFVAGAFAELKDLNIYYEGTVADWKNIRHSKAFLNSDYRLYTKSTGIGNGNLELNI